MTLNIPIDKYFVNRIFVFLFSIFILLLTSCNEGESLEQKKKFNSTTTTISTTFDEEVFENEKFDALLYELRICDPTLIDTVRNGIVPCSPKFFAFYSYNHKRKIEDAFALQVRKGVNNYPYRRLLIFTRERDGLVLMNGINGYLVETRSTENEIDDLVVAIVDNIGGHYERYDVLLRYENGKYHFVEALGDLEGAFDDAELKERASKEILNRIVQKKLMF